MKHIFAWWKKRGVIYSFSKDFNDPGSFQTYWKQLFKLCQPFRSDLGTLPNRAAVDPNAERKIRAADLYRPFENYNDCLKLLVRGVIKYNCMRGANEVCSIFIIKPLFYLHFLTMIFAASSSETQRF